MPSTEYKYNDIPVQGDDNKSSDVQVQENGNKASTTPGEEVNQYKEVPSTEQKYYDVQVQGDDNKNSTQSRYEGVDNVMPVHEESQPPIEPKETLPQKPLKKPTKIVVLKPPKRDEKPLPKIRKKRNNTILRNQSKITSLFKPVNNQNNPEDKNMSEVPQYHQANDVGGEVSAAWVNQTNLSDGESLQGLGDTCKSPDLATK